MADNQTVILRVQLDEGKTEEQLQKLVLDIEATKRAQSDLNVMRKNGLVADEAYALQTVALRTQLKGQRDEQTALTKNLELYRTASGELGNSYKGVQAQLSLAQRQFQQLDGSQDNSTESAKALTGVIADLRTGLTQTDETQKLFIRNVGNYPKGENLESLVRQLVALQEQTKNLTAGTEEASRAQMRIVGFQTQAAQAGAMEGKTFEETTNFIRQYGEAIRPATADLVALTAQQLQAAESGEATGEAMQQIGFKIGEAQKAIHNAAEALKDVPEQVAPAESGVRNFGDAVAEIDGTTGAFGGQVANLKQRFTQAKQGIDLAKAGFTGLKGAIAATGIGVFILALGALVEYFRSSDEGAEDLATAMAFLKGLFAPIGALALNMGKFIVKAFTDPKEAAADLLDFIEDQVVNRIKAFGVVFEAIKNGDLKGVANGVAQYVTGVENAIDKTQAFAAEMKSAASAAASISRARDELDDLERAEIVRTEKYRNEIERLVLTAKDRTLSEQQRLANLDKAGKLETQLLESTINLARQRLSIVERENFEAERAGKLSDEQKKAAEEAQAAVVRLAGQSRSLQQSIQNRRSTLLEKEAAEDKAAADKARAAAEKAAEARLQIRRDALTLQSVLLDRELKAVQAGSNEELNILQRRLNVGRDLELATKNLTVGQKKIIDAKYESDSLALTLDFNRRRLQAALQITLDTTAAQLAAQQSGSTEQLRLQAEQIENQRRVALAALDANADNTARVNAINAQAEQQRRQLEYAEATRLLTEFLEAKRQAIELDYAKDVIQEGEYQRQLAAVNKAGTEAQGVINADYRQSDAENRKRNTDNEIQQAQRATAATQRTEEVKQEIRSATLQSAQAYTDTIISLFGEESAAGQAALALKKVLGLAEITLNLQKELSANKVAGAQIAALVPPPAGPILGTAYVIAKDALSIASAAAGIASILKLEDGGIAYGPSHQQGGIPLYRRGRPAGIEIEGGEVVMTRRVTENPALLSMASTINQLAGGRALLPGHYLERGGLAVAQAVNLLGGVPAPVIDYKRLAAAMGEVSLSVSVRDTKAAAQREAFTQSITNS